MKMFEDSFPAFKMTLLIVSTIFVIGFGSFAMRCVQCIPIHHTISRNKKGGLAS